MKPFSNFYSLCALCALCGEFLFLSGPAQAAGATEVVWELTPYYTSAGAYISLTDLPLPDSRGDSELEIYRELLLQSFRPQVLLLEASVYPMPVLGTWIRRKNPGFYDDADIGNNLNWIESLTAGFPEPAALSVFLGSAMNLVRPGQARKGTNKGHVGYLASGGLRHIKDNVLISDNWYELEWKLKGERHFKEDRLSWSFRLGAKQHSHPEIADTVYLGLKRSKLDYNAPLLAWLDNTEGEFLVAMTSKGFALARSELLLEKRIPLRSWSFALALQGGFIYENDRTYTGSLREDDDNFIFVLRPNIEF